MASAFRLGIDFGTSNTVAVLRWPDGRFKPLLFDGSPLLPSAVFADTTRGLLVGREAAHSARISPERFEPNPKRRVDEGDVLLGDAEVPVVDLIAAVLHRVCAEVRAVTAKAPGEVMLTCPAAWGSRRRAVLIEAARSAGIDTPELISEPIAAATYFLGLPDVNLSVGRCLVVYDFGAGTFDASVVRRTAEGFEVLGSEGLPDAGGVDIDATILAHLAATYAPQVPEAWLRLEQPQTVADRRARRTLWEDVRTAKEVLSRASSTLVPLPLMDVDAPLGREQLERLARPILDRTVAATRAAIRNTGIDRSDLAAVFLVGGASRMPLAATLLHRALGIAPTAIEQPELIVAEGSVQTATADIDDADRHAPTESAAPIRGGEPATATNGTQTPAEPASAATLASADTTPASAGTTPAGVIEEAGKAPLRLWIEDEPSFDGAHEKGAAAPIGHDQAIPAAYLPLAVAAVALLLSLTTPFLVGSGISSFQSGFPEYYSFDRWLLDDPLWPVGLMVLASTVVAVWTAVLARRGRTPIWPLSVATVVLGIAAVIVLIVVGTTEWRYGPGAGALDAGVLCQVVALVALVRRRRSRRGVETTRDT